ncbi:MAG: FAD-linked oxidase C-terminal domain-containing protein, partial [Agrobacterium sp.]|uniref:FAD-linked oxidase C-terminal domain-containing protein n=1 Tax=Agrobacterium sp. TaxID=361 RepID=UPI0040344EBE
PLLHTPPCCCPLLLPLLSPLAVQVMLLAVSSFEQVTKVLAVARTRLGEVLSAFEFLDAESMHMVCSHAQVLVKPCTATTASEYFQRYSQSAGCPHVTADNSAAVGPS